MRPPTRGSRIRRRRSFVAIAVLVALLGAASEGGASSFVVTVNGEAVRVRAAATVDDALAAAGVEVSAGALLAVDGSVLSETVHPPRIWVDGIEATTLSPVWVGARIRAMDGPSQVEAAEAETFDVTQFWWGPEWYLSDPPVPGRALGRRGIMSGTLIRDAIEAPPIAPKPRTGAPEVALTFDDGPSGYTDEIVDILVARGIHATFFVVGNNVRRNPETTRRLAATGMGIGNHTWSHPEDFVNLDTAAVLSEIADTEDRLHELTGRRTTLFRPPGGFITDALREALGWTGHRLIMWTIDTSDYLRPSPEEIVAKVMGQLSHGAIILMHDGGGNRSATVEALPHLLDALAEAGYHVVPLPD